MQRAKHVRFAAALRTQERPNETSSHGRRPRPQAPTAPRAAPRHASAVNIFTAPQNLRERGRNTKNASLQKITRGRLRRFVMEGMLRRSVVIPACRQISSMASRMVSWAALRLPVCFLQAWT